MVSLIVAISANRVIGRDGDLPWHLPADLRHFKKTTMSHHLIIGRATWDELGRPLPEPLRRAAHPISELVLLRGRKSRCHLDLVLIPALGVEQDDGLATDVVGVAAPAAEMGSHDGSRPGEGLLSW